MVDFAEILGTKTELAYSAGIKGGKFPLLNHGGWQAIKPNACLDCAISSRAMRCLCVEPASAARLWMAELAARREGNLDALRKAQALLNYLYFIANGDIYGFKVQNYINATSACVWDYVTSSGHSVTLRRAAGQTDPNNIQYQVRKLNPDIFDGNYNPDEDPLYVWDQFYIKLPVTQSILTMGNESLLRNHNGWIVTGADIPNPCPEGTTFTLYTLNETAQKMGTLWPEASAPIRARVEFYIGGWRHAWQDLPAVNPEYFVYVEKTIGASAARVQLETGKIAWSTQDGFKAKAEKLVGGEWEPCGTAKFYTNHSGTTGYVSGVDLRNESLSGATAVRCKYWASSTADHAQFISCDRCVHSKADYSAGFDAPEYYCEYSRESLANTGVYRAECYQYGDGGCIYFAPATPGNEFGRGALAQLMFDYPMRGVQVIGGFPFFFHEKIGVPGIASFCGHNGVFPVGNTQQIYALRHGKCAKVIDGGDRYVLDRGHELTEYGNLGHMATMQTKKDGLGGTESAAIGQSMICMASADQNPYDLTVNTAHFERYQSIEEMDVVVPNINSDMPVEFAEGVVESQAVEGYPLRLKLKADIDIYDRDLGPSGGWAGGAKMTREIGASSYANGKLTLELRTQEIAVMGNHAGVGEGYNGVHLFRGGGTSVACLPTQQVRNYANTFLYNGPGRHMLHVGDCLQAGSMRFAISAAAAYAGGKDSFLPVDDAKTAIVARQSQSVFYEIPTTDTLVSVSVTRSGGGIVLTGRAIETDAGFTRDLAFDRYEYRQTVVYDEAGDPSAKYLALKFSHLNMNSFSSDESVAIQIVTDLDTYNYSLNIRTDATRGWETKNTHAVSVSEDINSISVSARYLDFTGQAQTVTLQENGLALWPCDLDFDEYRKVVTDARNWTIYLPAQLQDAEITISVSYGEEPETDGDTYIEGVMGLYGLFPSGYETWGNKRDRVVVDDENGYLQALYQAGSFAAGVSVTFGDDLVGHEKAAWEIKAVAGNTESDITSQCIIWAGSGLVYFPALPEGTRCLHVRCKVASRKGLPLAAEHNARVASISNLYSNIHVRGGSNGYSDGGPGINAFGIYASNDNTIDFGTRENPNPSGTERNGWYWWGGEIADPDYSSVVTPGFGTPIYSDYIQAFESLACTGLSLWIRSSLQRYATFDFLDEIASSHCDSKVAWADMQIKRCVFSVADSAGDIPANYTDSNGVLHQFQVVQNLASGKVNYRELWYEVPSSFSGSLLLTAAVINDAGDGFDFRVIGSGGSFTIDTNNYDNWGWSDNTSMVNNYIANKGKFAAVGLCVVPGAIASIASNAMDSPEDSARALWHSCISNGMRWVESGDQVWLGAPENRFIDEYYRMGEYSIKAMRTRYPNIGLWVCEATAGVADHMRGLQYGERPGTSANVIH